MPKRKYRRNPTYTIKAGTPVGFCKHKKREIQIHGDLIASTQWYKDIDGEAWHGLCETCFNKFIRNRPVTMFTGISDVDIEIDVEDSN